MQTLMVMMSMAAMEGKIQSIGALLSKFFHLGPFLFVFTSDDYGIVKKSMKYINCAMTSIKPRFAFLTYKFHVGRFLSVKCSFFRLFSLLNGKAASLLQSLVQLR